MRLIAGVLTVSLLVFTALAMALNPVVHQYVVFELGPLPLTVFDVLLVLSTGAWLYCVSLHVPTDPLASNRAALRTTAAYLLYQVAIVAPVAMIWHDIGPGEAYRGLDARLALVLIFFFYSVALRYLTTEHVVGIVNAVALALLVYAIGRYLIVGPEGAWEGGIYRVRVLWGGSVLLFGWLAIAGLFLGTRLLRAYALGIAGLVGIVLENHRSGYVALLAAVLVFVALSRRLTARVVAIAVIAVAGGLVLAAASPTIRDNAVYSLTTMFNARSDATAWDRVERTSLAWDFVQAHPFGDYIWTGTYYLVDLGNAGFEPHNFVIQTLDKQGLLSGGILFFLIGTVVWIGWKIRRRSRLGIVMTAYLVFYVTFCLFNTNFDAVENVTLFALTVALILSANRVSAERERKESALEEGQEDVAPPAPAARRRVSQT